MAVFDVCTLGVSDNKITFNDETLDPYFRVAQRFITKREIQEYDIALPEQMGVADYQTLIGKEYLVLQGKAYPNSDQSYDVGRRLLRKVSALQIEQADSLSDSGYVPFIWPEYDGNKMIEVKVLYCDLKENTKQGEIQPFTLLCKIKNPIIQSTSAKTATITFGSTSVSTPVGGFAIPFAIPLAITSSVTKGTSVYPFTYPVTYGGTKNTQIGNVVNSGDVPAYPTIQIFGPISKPRLTNVTTGKYIELNVNLPTLSDSAYLSYSASNITVNALNANAYGLLTSGSELFTIASGTNTFSLTGASVGTGAYAVVNFLDTWPIS